MGNEGERNRIRRDVEAYGETVERLEPDIHPIDASAFYASAAISLRRIADNSDKLVTFNRYIAAGTFVCITALAVAGVMACVKDVFFR